MDYFSERLSASYIQSAIVFAVLAGIIQIILPLRAPGLVSPWSIAEGILVLALAYGLWRRNLASAVGLLVVRSIGAISWSYHSGRAPELVAIVQVAATALAAAAILLGRGGRSRMAPTSPSAATGGPDGTRTG